MKSIHQEIDNLRRQGAFKEALDLARYLHTKNSHHLQIKRSYGWALYSYLKVKLRVIEGLIYQREMSPIEVVIAVHPRVIELNQLCREYRVHKLLITDLCYSLILHGLCRLSPPPLGLYGLLKWSRATGMRPEDYEPYKPYEDPKQSDRSVPTSSKALREPLIFLIAHRLEELVVSIDQLEEMNSTLKTLDPFEVAHFTARVHLHIIEKGQLPSPSFQWNILWLSRRAGAFDQGISCGLNLLSNAHPRADTWWEISLCLAQCTRIDIYKLSLDKQDFLSPEMTNAYFCSLRSLYEAHAQGITEPDLSTSYAQTGYWAYNLGKYKEARMLLTRAIQSLQKWGQPVPFNWVKDLSILGDEVSSPESISLIEDLYQETQQYTEKWMKQRVKRDAN